MDNILSRIWYRIQTELFPYLDRGLKEELTDKQKEFVSVLALIRVEDYVRDPWWSQGRPVKDRKALARAYIGKMVYNMSTTRDFMELLATSKNLKYICGWDEFEDLPSESTFSRSFSEFARISLPAKVHKELIDMYEGYRIVGHISRDSTDIRVREKVVNKQKDIDEPKLKHKRGRPKKGEVRFQKEISRLKRQTEMTLDEMLNELPKHCDWGFKKKKGKDYFWKGHKLHIDWADGEIPISCILTSASLHDSQAAIPLSMISSKRVTNLYDLMDSAYDAKEIKEHSIALGHKPIIDCNPRKGQKIEMHPAEKRRYDVRSTAERGFSMLKESFGGCMIRVRGYEKVFCHLMFGILALSASRLLNLLM